MQNEQLLLTLIKALTSEQQVGATPSDYASPFRIGKQYFIRTATMYWTGRVKAIEGHFAVLEEAAWIADVGRYNEAMEDSSKYNEVEPVKQDAIVNLDAVIDAVEITYPLLRSVK